MLKKIIAVDFDGTITKENCYPECKEINPYCSEVLNELHNEGYIITLNTCRHGESLDTALEYCKNHNIPLDYVNENPSYLIQSFGDCRKIFAHYYIDDMNIVGLVDWLKIKDIIQGKENITISKELYRRLLEDREFLECLKACGVDNWDGYTDAVAMMEEGN